LGLRRTDGRKTRTAEDRERARAERERRRGNLSHPPTPDQSPTKEPEGAQLTDPEPQGEPLDVGPAPDRVAWHEQDVDPVEPSDREIHAEPQGEPLDVGPAPDRVAWHEQDVDPVEPSGRESHDEPQGEPPDVGLKGRPRLERPHLHRPHMHRPQVHRPHLHRPQLRGRRRGRSFAARLGTLAALALAALVVGAGAYLVARALKHKPASPKPLATVRVLIPEGYTAAQIAKLVSADGLKGDYLKAAASAARPTQGHYRAPAGEHNPEGFLFPATYEMYAGAPVGELVAKQLTAFAESFGSQDRARAKTLGVTPYQLLIVASMVEREAALERERPLVAAVIYNRLRRSMPLGIDATIRYALKDYTRPLTEAQLHSSSPYNTRIHTGLPPTPISNPGLASIEAAANPAHVPYLYYVARADGCPGQLFSSSYAQFEHNAAAYQAALRANGGRVPTCRRGK
jgi:peptidoglycan lytic transglycosylase G